MVRIELAFALLPTALLQVSALICITCNKTAALIINLMFVFICDNEWMKKISRHDDDNDKENSNFFRADKENQLGTS